MKQRSRLTPADRKRAILDAALRSAVKYNYARMTRQLVALEAQCSPALVSAYFSTMPKLRRAVMSEAVRTGHAAVVAQGLAAGDTKARKAPAGTLDEARALLAGV